MKRVAFVEWEQCVLVAFGSRPPDDDEWKGYTEFLRNLNGIIGRALIMSRGGTLESHRRKEVDAILDARWKRDRRLAVVTNSTVARGVVKALSLIDPTYRAFAPADMDAALTYLEIHRARWTEMKGLATSLDAQVD